MIPLIDIHPNYLYKVFVYAGRAYETGTTKCDVDRKQLARGIEIEMEHTSDREVAERIALDHLSEFPSYYTALDFIEAVMEAGMLEEVMAVVAERTEAIS